ncbi:MAG: 2-oxo acid dehydrogenase subunit E2 [Oligoflexales bacterium]|nr:2-oxo acid dehydrogenase subunit E2 [Oligoflexales bacterium]
MFRKNVDFSGLTPTSPWRKIAIGTWRTCGDPSVYGTLEIDTSQILKVCQNYQQEGVKMTPTVILTRALALSLNECKSLNSILRFGRLHNRKDVSIFLQVSNEDKSKDDLSGLLIRDCDKKSLKEIAEEVQKKSERIKKGDDFEYKKTKSIIDWVPGILMGPLLKAMGFIMFDLNLWSPLFNTPRDSFGSAMITSVGMLGIDQGFAPLVPYSHCPLLFSVGQIKEKAVVENGHIVIRPMLTIGVTLDHRLIDGKGASFILKALKQYLKNPT